MDPIQKLARRIRGVEKLAFRAATQPQLAHSSIEDGAIQSMEDGSLKAVIGKQYDGTQAIVVVNGPTPPTPTAPTGDPALEGAKLRWDGLFADGSVSPMDFSRVELHVSTDPGFTAEFADTLKATFETPRGGEVFIALPGGVEHYARLVARSLTGARSAASAVFAVTPQSIADSLPAPTDGDTPASSPAPAVGGGIGSLFLSWVPVVNADPVTYEVHASDTAGFTPGPTTLLTETPATQYVVRHLPGSTDPVPHTAPTYVRLVAKDPDGAAAPGAESSGTAILIETVDIADGAITPVKIPDDAITAAKIAAGAVGTTEIALDAITSDLIAAGAIGSGELATDAVTAAKIAAGAVGTSEIALDAVTNDLIAAGAVTATEISDGAISTPKLAAGAVTAAKIAADTITANELAAGAVTASEIAAGAVTAEKLTVGSLGASMVRNGQFEEVSAADPTRPAGWRYNTIWGGGTPALQTTSPISGTRSVDLPCTPTTASHVISERFPVIPGQVLAVKYRTKADVAQPAGLYAIINGGATPTDTSVNVDSTGTSSYNQPVVTALTEHTAIFTIPAGMSWAAFTVLNYGLPSGTTCTVTVDDISVQQVIVSAQISDGAISTPKLTAGAVTAAKIAAGAVTTTKLAANAVTANEIAAGAVTTTKLAANAVTANEIAANAVTASEIATDAVTAGKILAEAVTAEKIAAAAITAEKIAAGAIVTDKLAANAVSADKLAATIVLATQIMTGPSDQNRVLLDATGIQVLKADNSQRAVLPTDPASPVFIKGTAELDQVVINDKMTIRGTNNAISPGSNIQFQGSVKDPQSQISATIDWETVQTWMDPTQYSHAIRGLDFDSGDYHFANLFLGTQILAYNEAGAFAGNVGLPDLPAGVGSNYSGTYQAYGGIVKVGGYYFTLGTVHRISDNKNVWQVRKWTIDFIGNAYTFVGYADIGVDTVDFNGSGTYPILGKGLTTGLSLAWWAGVSGGYTLHMQNIDTSTCALLTSGGADYGSVIAAGNIGDLIYFEQGNFDFGAARTLFAHKQGGGQVVRSFSGTSQIVEDTFELPVGTVGVCYNPTSTNSFRSLQTSGSHTFNVKHTLINWITGGDSTTAVWWGTFTYRNTSSGYETGQSLYKSFTMGKRKRLTITTPAIPPGGTANDPNAVRMWVGANPTQPARTAMWTFAAPAAGVITATQNTQVFGSPNTNPPATNTFPASAVSKLVDSSGNALVNSDGDAVLRDVLLRGLSSSASDANGPLVKVNTDGSGRIGPMTWTAARAAKIDVDWVYPTLSAGWVNAGGSWELTGYCRRNGIVYLKGVMNNGTNGQAAFFLPAGFLPAGAKGFINVNTGSGGSRTQIRGDGAVYVDSGNATSGWFLSGISFPAEA